MEEEIIMEAEDGENQREKFVWSRPMVLSLIEEYKKVQHEFKDTSIKKKHVWRKIAEQLADRGFPDVTEDMCDKKWRNLKKTFKEIYVGQRGSPLRTKWCFYNAVEGIFKKDPNIVNAASVSLSSKPVLTKKKISGPDGQEWSVDVMEVLGNMDDEYLDDTDIVAGDESDEQLFASLGSAISQQAPIWFTEFLQQYHQDEQKKMEMLNKMHADIVALEERKCALLETLIEKLGTPTELDVVTQYETPTVFQTYDQVQPDCILIENYVQ